MVVGEQIGGYKVLQQIGEGGMGSVWLAQHAMLGRRAAIKVLHREMSRNQEIVKRFFNEARAAAAVADPGIVQIFDFGHHSDGSAFIVMELLEGETLDRRVARLGRLAIADALRIMRQLAASLGAAHARGIVHRDLKPENIFVVRDPEVPGGERVKVVDFGIAKLVGDMSVKTATHAVMGTPQFMSPEQCRGASQVDQRSDVYALGCMLFTLLVGHPPFDAEGAGLIMVKQMKEPAPKPSSLVPGIPPQVDAVVLNALAKEPAHRFASGLDLATAIDTLLVNMPAPGARPVTQPPPMGHHPITQPPPMGQTPTTLSGSSGTKSPTGAPSPHSRAGLWLGVAGGTLLVGGLVTFLATRDGGDGDKPEAAKATPEAALATTMKDVARKFIEWGKQHVGAPCPDFAALGGAPFDPWNHPLVLTCTDQPANQMIGIVSAGADGKLGTEDDIASWQMGKDVVDALRGARWGKS